MCAQNVSYLEKRWKVFFEMISYFTITYKVPTMAPVRNYYFPNYNILITNFDNYSSNSIICDDLMQKKLHPFSNYWINFPTKNSTWRTGAIVRRKKSL